MNAHRHDIIVLGGSAGGVKALHQVLESLPADLPATVFIVQHRGSGQGETDTLADVLHARTPLTVRPARDGQPFAPGQAYVAPADCHLLLENGVLRLERSPRESRFRPAIDVLFKSAATVYGRRVVGVLLSGAWGEDGTAGLWQIKNRGGVTVVQDLDDAEFAPLPRHALDHVSVDHVLPARWIGPKLLDLTARADASEKNNPPPARILIVEDEGIVAANLQQSLAGMGYAPLDWVASGEAALVAARQERPDLMLMDISLAGRLTGVETARQVWQTWQIPVVFCTALSDVQTLRAVQSTENYGYVVKPFHGEAVRAAIELALARRERELRHPAGADA